MLNPNPALEVMIKTRLGLIWSPPRFGFSPRAAIAASSLIASMVLVPGCQTSGQSPPISQADQVSESPISVLIDWQAAHEAAGPAQLTWVRAYSEPDLTQLVEEAHRSHRDIRALAKRIERASALANAAALALEAGIAKSPEDHVSGREEHMPSYRQQASWERDVWQRLQQGKYSSPELAQTDIGAARQSLNASIVSTYFLLLEANRQKTILRGHLISSRQFEREMRAETSLVDISAQSQTSLPLDLADGEQRLISIDEARRKASEALEIMIARFPPVGLSAKQYMPVLPPTVQTGLSSDGLARRPDLYFAERRLANSEPRLNQSQAARLPAFILVEEGGGPSQNLIEIVHSENTDWRDADRLFQWENVDSDHAALISAKPELRRAKAQYEEVALNAFKEVYDHLETEHKMAERRAYLEIAEVRAKTQLDSTLQSSETSEQQLSSVLTDLQALYQSRASLLAIRRQQLNHHATLMLATGAD